MTDTLLRIEALFHAALTVPAGERKAWLQTMESDPTIRDTVGELLANDDQTHNPLQPALLAVLRLDHSTPQRIGRYRVVGELGEGGMSNVLLAERDIDGRPQRVALKLLYGASTASLRRKAARERALLAALNHRGIASLIDGGESDEGVPYLVMEHVEGIPLLRYLSEQRPSQRERLLLFRQICLAIEHAHQRLILHLDLKPSNVLVRADGSTALIDFGIGQGLDDLDTGERTAAFTPIYAAPEQRSGAAMTTGTDVYMAGLLLVEILTDGALSQRARRKRHDPPNVALSEAPIRDALKGDLSRLVAHATAPAVEDRYPSITALRMDIDHYLEGRMLAASRQAWWVRGMKFCRRNRWPLTGASAAALLAIAFVVQLSEQRSRALAAEQNALLAQDMQASVLLALSPPGNPQAQARIKALLQRERLRLQDSSSAHARDPGWRSIASVVAVAEIYVSIGDPEPALKAANGALQLLGDMQRSRRGADDDLLARALAVRGQAFNGLERYAEAEADFERMMTLRRRNSRQDPQILAAAWMLYGKAAIEWQDFATAEQALASVQSLTADMTASNMATSNSVERIELAIAKLDAASGSNDALGLAAQRKQALLDLANTTLDPRSPLWIDVRMAVSRWHQIEGKPDIALAEAQRALAQSQQLFGERSIVTATIENNLGTMLADLGRYREALARFDQARAVQARLSPDKATVLAAIDINRCSAYYNLGDYALAANSAQAALDALPQTHVAYRRLRNIGLSNLARARSEQGQHAAAIRSARQMLSDPWLKTAAPLENAFGKISMFIVLLNAGALDEAQSILDETSPVLEKNLPADHSAFIYMARRRGLLAAARGRFEDADQAFGIALARMDASHDDPVTRAEIRVARAQAAQRLGDGTRAKVLLEQALPILRAETSAASRWLNEAEQLFQTLSTSGADRPAATR